MLIRRMELRDCDAINTIYNYYITHTAITFDLAPWQKQEREHWFAQFDPSSRYQAWVAEQDQQIVGFAYNTPFNAKQAFHIASEITIYAAPDAGGRGIGSQLMRTLLEGMREQDLRRAYSLITLPNPSSLALHRRFGFQQVGQLNDVGEKFGQYHSVAMLECDLTI
ncbi:N-acetyltransferase family protein [Salinivibrio sp. EAGSL]|uniref:GNAT family N-acetyltransferase n=1 Tax=Salinivibrio sp. EAGSL TaxID=2738468 RepID=UPI00158978D9|nr:GNAT family N-acetyltransferase [Salinivibrio sp. EAGSL]NUY55194.1 N-acetyltransferase family protein [Salinivibrio sp. EAGSL]